MKTKTPIVVAILTSFLFIISCSESGPCADYSNSIDGKYRQVRDPDRYITLQHQTPNSLSVVFQFPVQGDIVMQNCIIELNDADCAIGRFTFTCDPLNIFGGTSTEPNISEEKLSVQSRDVIFHSDSEYRRVE